MIEPSGQLVAGDEVERETRTTCREWMTHGLHTAGELANTDAGDPSWPDGRSGDVLSGADRADWLRTPTTFRPIGEAVEAGWLVAVATQNKTPPGAMSGLTVAVKDIIDVAGMPVRNGTPGALWRDPTESAPAWSTLASAGARCIGKAATHEMAWGVTTPQIANPIDPARIAGGSSGGSAACVAAQISQGALGTDTGGSVRIPAALCGVVGFRPTTGSIDTGGITPLAPEQDVVGPIAGDVRTCAAMLEVLLGRPLDLNDPAARTVRGLRIGVLTKTGPLDAETATAYVDTLELLESMGVEVIACDTRLAQWSGSVSLLTMLASSAVLHAGAVRADPTGFGSEARALLTVGTGLSADTDLINRARNALATATADLFSKHRLDAFLTPTTPCVAPDRRADTVTIDARTEAISSALTRFTAWASVTAMPALSVPVHTSGMPVGAQIMAPPNREDTCARVALCIEEITGRVQTD
ncbi:MAG: amidase [Actinomycetota bacterium]|nr:amidase [Actinomycetota bacterium]